MEMLFQDLRCATSMMRRNGVFTAAALITLALGIGASTAVFSIPGVSAAGAGNMMPLVDLTAVTSFPLRPFPGATPVMTRSGLYVVTPGYAEALGLRLKDWRFFTDADARPATRKMLVNEEFVRQYLAGPAVGRDLDDLYPDETGIRTEIVGVVGNVLKDGNDRAPRPDIYFVHGSATHRIDSAVNILVRTDGNPGVVASLLRDIVREADHTAVLERVTPLAALVARSVDQPRFSMVILGTFAALAVALASVGLYGLVSYSLAQQRRDLAIRAAIGARRRDLVSLVLWEGLSVTALGIAVGLLIALWVTRFMRGILFGVTALDSVAFAAAPLVLLAVAGLACARPALRAASTDPALALRVE